MAQHHIGQDVRAVEFARQVDESGTVWFRDVPEGSTVLFTTKNSIYQYDPHGKRIRGGVYGNEWRQGTVAGSTFGGSMLAIDRLIPGALAEMYAPTMMTTSPLLSVEVVSGGWGYRGRKAP